MIENVIFVVCAVLYAMFCIGVYRAGLRDGMKREKGLPPERVMQHHERKTRQQREQETRMNKIMQNIDAYDGTGKGQKEVK